MTFFRRTLTGLGVALSLWLGWTATAAACGCFNPPVPPPGVTAEEFAVAQQSELIIFEVEPGFVTAHVLIRYQGKPESFAWLLPVPSEPELDLSENIAFGIIDSETSPVVTVQSRDLCPVPSYRCEYHPTPECGTPYRDDGCSCAFGHGGDSPVPGGFADAGSAGSDTGASRPPDEPPVEVISREVIGSYETIVFAAADAMAAVTWLQDEGFIVNDTTTPYMQPYLDAGMLFVASRLVPGAGVEEIKPLQMRYASDTPMIPLQLTAVAAEPHLTVTAFVFGETSFEPVDQPIIELDETMLTTDAAGRSNYPMVLARAVDDAGGDAFVVEYDGPPPVSSLGMDSCCGDFDRCRVGNDGQCQCPGSDFDAIDCEAIEGLAEGMALVADLASRHASMTRLTTRLSAEEMSFDPMFQPSFDHDLTGRLTLTGQLSSLARCVDDVMDQDAYDAITARQLCAATYCGVGAECAATAMGGGCACGPGTVARSFTDADGARSVTCVPEVAPVDFGADGLPLPDACASADCGSGSCVDLGGFPACRCNPGEAAVVVEGTEAPTCVAITEMTGSPGAEDFTTPLEDVSVCAPPPPSCSEYGWLVETTGGIRGEACPSNTPAESALEIPEPPTCADLGLPTPGDVGGGGGCSAALRRTPLGPPLGAALLCIALARVFIRRRGKRTGR